MLAIVRPGFQHILREQALRPFRFYEKAVEKYPIRTKFLLGGFLGGVGDFIVQWREEKLDHRRLLAFTAFNGAFSASANHYWFGLLASQKLTVVRKLALQHLFFNPIVYLPTFYFAFGTMIGMAPSSCLTKLRAEGMKTYGMLLTTWLPVSFVQFKFIPQCHQVVFVSMFNVLWNAMLSLTTSEPSGKIAKNTEACLE